MFIVSNPKLVIARSTPAVGADLACIGRRFIGGCETNAFDAYKHAVVDLRGEASSTPDLFTGAHGNYTRSSIDAVPPAAEIVERPAQEHEAARGRLLAA